MIAVVAVPVLPMMAVLAVLAVPVIAVVAVLALPGKRDLDGIFHQREAKSVPFAQQGEGPHVPGPGALHELRSGQLLGQLEVVDPTLNGQVLAGLHGALPLTEWP